MDLKELKKKEIADSARALFTEYGYKSVSMEQIAQRANVAKGTVYLYFKDKEDLFYQLAREFLIITESFVKEIENRGLELSDEIHEVVYKLLMYRRDQKFLYKICREARELKTPSACAVVEMIDSQISSYLENRLNQAMDNGLIKKRNASFLTFVILKIYYALAFEWEEKHEPLDEKLVAESVRQFLHEGLMSK